MPIKQKEKCMNVDVISQAIFDFFAIPTVIASPLKSKVVQSSSLGQLMAISRDFLS